jgi:hypothetical protein
MNYFSCSGGSGVDPTKSSLGHIVRSGAFSRNVDTLFFMLGWAQCRFMKKQGGTRYVELVFLGPGGYADHVVGSSASGAQNVDAIFHSRVGPVRIPEKACQDMSCCSHKNILGHITPNLWFCIWCDLRVTNAF